MPEVIETRDALETKLAELAAQRRTEEDMAAIDDRAGVHGTGRADQARGCGVEADEQFHGAVTAAGYSPLLPPP